MAEKKARGKKADAKSPQQQIDAFKKEYPNVELASIVDNGEGQYQLFFKPKLATLDPLSQAGYKVPVELQDKMKMSASSYGAPISYRDPLFRQNLDLIKPSVVNEPPHVLYTVMRGYYRSMDVFGTFIDTMVDLALAGFENDCEDADIKAFYDNWCEDVDLYQVLEWIFQEFFTTGFVRTYKVLGSYTPETNTLKPLKNPPEPKKAQKTTADRKKRWSRGHIPLAYTVLNPVEIEIKGSVFLNQTRVVLKPNPDMEDLIKREHIQTELTAVEKELLDNIPPELKRAILTGDEVELDPMFVGEIDYRRMPYEKYPMPPYARAVEIVEYKQRMREADYSTLDAVTSEILVVTVGDKDNPVLDTEDLVAVTQLFNTVQKAYAVVWNHTLKVERVQAKNVNEIFGAKKYEQAELDMSGSIGLPRALLDGAVIGQTSKDALDFSVKATLATLKRCRRQVTRWIVNEYKQIAEAYGFKRYPSIRWDESVLKDDLAVATVVMGLCDRRIISYFTGHKMLGLDPEFEQAQLTREMPDVVAGKYGILGSPFQQSKGGPGGGGDDHVQPVQRAPKGTPSGGRPSGNPAPKTPKPASPEGQIKEVVHKETKHVKETIRKGAIQELKKMSLAELAELENMLRFVQAKRTEELANLVDEAEVNREDN